MNVRCKYRLHDSAVQLNFQPVFILSVKVCLSSFLLYYWFKIYLSCSAIKNVISTVLPLFVSEQNYWTVLCPRLHFEIPFVSSIQGDHLLRTAHCFLWFRGFHIYLTFLELITPDWSCILKYVIIKKSHEILTSVSRLLWWNVLSKMQISVC